MLKDYTKSNNALLRFFSGHWNRHHVERIHAICILSEGKSVEELLLELKSISLINSRGTLANIIHFIDGQDLFHERICNVRR